LINFTSRGTMIERERAVEGARNPGYSKLGSTIVDIYCKPDKGLTRKISAINSEIRRMEATLRLKQKRFIKNCQVLNYDPMILVERPASAENIKKARERALAIERNDKDYVEDSDKPRYMRQLRSKARTPSTLTTIDAFTVKSKKKRNIWNETLDEKEPPEFVSTIRPHAKLTQREKSDLQVGWSYHKPRLTAEEDLPPPPRKLADSEEENTDDETGPFITQMAKVRRHSTKTPNKSHNENLNRHVDKSVRFESSKPNSPIKPGDSSPIGRSKISSR